MFNTSKNCKFAAAPPTTDVCAVDLEPKKRTGYHVTIVAPMPPPYGGMSIQAEKMSWLLQRDGYSVVTVATNQAAFHDDHFVAKTPVIRTFFNTLLFLRQLRDALRQTDVVYFLTGFVNFFMWITYPALVLIKLHRKPVILSARGGDARRFLTAYKRIVTPVMSKVDVITTPSAFLQKAFQETLQLDTVIVPNIADLEQFQFRDRKRFQPKLLVTRNLELIYDLETVLRAFQLIAREDPSAVLGIVGDGSQREKLEQRARGLEISEKVTFYGQLKHEDLPSLYDAYDIYVNASRVDNLPGVLLEAFASGLPVVSTNAGGIPFIVEDGVTGLLSDIGHSSALAQNVIRILKQPEFGRALAQAGRREALKYSWEHIGPMMSELLADVSLGKGGDNRGAHGNRC